MLRPAEGIALYRSDMEDWPGVRADPDWRQSRAAWVRANEAFRQDLIDELRRDGPLTWRELPDTCIVSWRSTGWNNNRNVAMMLEMLVLRGEVAVAGRRGRDRLWDLASRVYPDDDVVPAAEARQIRNERRLRAMGISRAHGQDSQVEPNGVEEVGEAAVIEGVRGQWRVDPTYLGGTFSGRAAVISPIDRLIFDRQRMTDIFEFDYNLEMYKPAAKRQWESNLRSACRVKELRRLFALDTTKFLHSAGKAASRARSLSRANPTVVRRGRASPCGIDYVNSPRPTPPAPSPGYRG